MALTTSYLVSVKNVKPFFDSLTTAKAPNAVTQKFIEGLGFKSTNDRLFIGVLKGLGFLDPNAVPTEKYFKFLDQSQSKKVLAEAIEEAYGDLFAIHTKAHELSLAEVKNKLRTLTQGKHSENVIGLMSSTFKALTAYAEWDATKKDVFKEVPIIEPDTAAVDETIKPTITLPTEAPEDDTNRGKKTEFHYNIQVHLPESRDESVYDAIFKSLRKHLF